MFYGWWILVLSFVSSSFYGAVVMYGFTSYINPLVDQFGWSYTAISVIASLRGAEIGLMDFIIGVLLDRFGSRKVIFSGYVVIGSGFLLLSRVDTLVPFYILFIAIFLGGSCLGHVFTFYTIARWFRKRLGLTFGIAMAGYGAGGFAVPLIVYLIDRVGIMTAFVLFGLIALLFSAVMLVFLRNRPEDIGSTLDGLPREELDSSSSGHGKGGASEGSSYKNFTLKEVLASPSFWVLVWAGASTTFSIQMLITHVMPYLEDIGYTRYLAGIVAMTIPLISMIGRLGVGFASDFTSGKSIFIFCLIFQAIGVLLFRSAGLHVLWLPSALFFGIGYGGSIVIRLKILREYYGGNSLGSITGLYHAGAIFFGLLGPLTGGFIFDTFGSYDFAWIISAAFLGTGTLIMLLLKNPQSIKVKK